MKKILRVLPLLLVFLLVGCQNMDFGCLFSPGTDGCVDGTVDYGDVTFDKTLDIIDISTEYTFESETLNVYKNEVNVDIMYVEINEFLAAFQEGLITYESRSDGDLYITFKYPVDDFGNEFYDVTLKFNARDNIISFSDFRLSSLMNKEGTTEYDPSYEFIDSDIKGLTVQKFLPVNNYGIDIIKMDRYYYIPLYLANFILTGSMFETYQIENEIYVFDDPSVLAESISGNYDLNFDPDKDMNSVIYDTVNFTALVFDFYYGLKDELGVDRFRKEFSEYDLYSAVDLVQYSERFQQFILDLDDLHTGIYTLGYDQDNMSILMPSEDSRTGQFYASYQSNECALYTESVILIEHSDVYVLKINSFDLDLAQQLQEKLINIKGAKDIIIDLSCNPGGSLGAVMDLITFLTYRNFDLNYSNPALNIYATETYKANEYKVLTNDIYIYTSKVTFSAANLFVSMAKENDLAVILGTKTSGGACAVEYTVLPNNMIITYSSNFMMMNRDEESIEFGIEPDVEYEDDVSVLDAYYQYIESMSDITDGNDLDNTGVTTIDIDITDNSDLSMVDFTVNLGDNDENYEFVNYTVTIYTSNDRTLYKTEVITSGGYNYQLELDQTYELVEIVVKCDFYYEERLHSREVYKNSIDEMPDHYYDQGVDNATLGIRYYSYFDSFQDVDTIKITVTTTDTYKIFISNVSYNMHAVYDINGNLIEEGNNFGLEPGEYYIQMGAAVLGNYSYEVRRMYDDTIDPTYLSLEEGYNSEMLRIDFEGDKETLIFTLEEEALLTLRSTSSNGDCWFTIINEEGIYSNDSLLQYVSNQARQYEWKLKAGTYILNVIKAEVEETNLGFEFRVDYSPDELQDDYEIESNNYGVLEDGNNTITYEGMWDSDVYLLILDAPSYVEIYSNGNSEICLLEDGEWTCGNLLTWHFDAGTYYIKFVYKNEYYSGYDVIEVNIY